MKIYELRAVNGYEYSSCGHFEGIAGLKDISVLVGDAKDPSDLTNEFFESNIEFNIVEIDVKGLDTTEKTIKSLSFNCQFSEDNTPMWSKKMDIAKKLTGKQAFNLAQEKYTSENKSIKFLQTNLAIDIEDKAGLSVSVSTLSKLKLHGKGMKKNTAMMFSKYLNIDLGRFEIIDEKKAFKGKDNSKRVAEPMGKNPMAISFLRAAPIRAAFDNAS